MVGLFVLWLANRATGPISIFDAGLYHLNTIRWIATEPIIPGLGNLHRRLGLNSSYFLLFAFLESAFWHARAQHILNGLLQLVLAIQAGVSLSRILKRERIPEPFDMLRVILVVPLIGQCLYHAADTSHDFAVFAIGLVVGIELFRLIFSRNQDERIAFSAFVIITVSALGICFKLSFVAVGVLAILIAVTGMIRRKACNTGKLLLLLAPAFVLLSVWIIRGTILTGYVLYPSTLLPLDVDWRVPRLQATVEWRWAMSWARLPYAEPDQVLSRWNWLSPWFGNLFSQRVNLFEVILPLALAVTGLIVLPRRKSESNEETGRIWLFQLTFLVSIVYWFVTAPDPRFAGASLWLFAAGILTFAVRGKSLQTPPRTLILVGFLIVLLITRVYYAPLIVRPSGEVGLSPVPVAKLTTFITHSGLTLFVPGGPKQCWDSPLPCTPYPLENMRLRRPNEIRSGFLPP